MILFPAIDLKAGQCVRLRRGDMESATVFHHDPATQAREFQAQGFSHLHLIDLDGAVSGRPTNADAVLAVRQAVTMPIQLGGGIRDMERIAFWLEQGIDRIILGTAAIENPQLAQEAARAFPERIIIALDERGGKVAVKGWRETRAESAAEAALRFRDMGVAALLHTAIEQDGMMEGMNIPASLHLARETQLPVILSGGFRGAPDIERLLQAQASARAEGLPPAPIEGIIAGRSLYENLFSVPDILSLLRAAPPC